MNLETLITYENEYLAATYGRFPQDIAYANGSICHSAAGTPLIDFTSGIGVNSLGFGHPAWKQAVKQQIDDLCHISNLFYTTPQTRLAKALCERTGMKKVFFANSGAEANEGAIKTARKYSQDRYSADRCEIITLQNSFHGRTIATLAATGQDVFHRHFGPFPPGFVYAKPNDCTDLTQKINAKTCAIMIECIQGEGGVIPLELGFVACIADICKQQDILFIVDEVQTGVGRTGRFLCSEYYNIEPDIITLAKGLGGGLPIGAVLFGEKTKYTLGKGDHGTTFGGNPVIAAGANVILELVDDQLLEEVCLKGEHIAKKLTCLPGITHITGKGLMLGIGLETGLSSTVVATACIAQGLLILTAKEKLRLLPPLTITIEELDQGLEILKKVLAEL